MRTTAANVLDSRDPVSQTRPQTASIQFFLTEGEFKEANVTRRSWWSNPYYCYAGRIVCAFGAYFFIALPSWLGKPWPVLVRTEPLTAIKYFILAALDIYVALGQPGIDVLNRRINRFDLQREITLTQDLVKISRGPKRREKSWNQFACFYESSTMYVLKEHGWEFWTVPKRAFEPGVEPMFRYLLESRLQRR